jgi:hypothetical protein
MDINSGDKHHCSERLALRHPACSQTKHQHHAQHADVKSGNREHMYGASRQKCFRAVIVDLLA